eukprot:CAMPEP_0170498138 /NCGR_PEP_ID=MMETSP0208-20121228/26949_1 /TAXON_ID=197538 /ORGANISM="Strombidium inclinatum, Strain S3" /LENGTH=173 /DNA_ID=CAMNT_0010775221 /DNA_START=1300 /DNA_END=1821 /DNA_ORIENTATION=-
MLLIDAPTLKKYELCRLMAALRDVSTEVAGAQYGVESVDIPEILGELADLVEDIADELSVTDLKNAFLGLCHPQAGEETDRVLELIEKRIVEEIQGASLFPPKFPGDQFDVGICSTLLHEISQRGGHRVLREALVNYLELALPNYQQQLKFKDFQLGITLSQEQVHRLLVSLD